MTLIITTVGPRAVTMVGDRRLTCNGRIEEDDAGKQGFWTSADAAVLYAYTGVAKVGSFDLRRWISNTLYEVADDGGYGFLAMISRLTVRATEIFANHPLLKRVGDKRTTIIFAGYMGNGDPVSALVSNFEDASGYPLNVANKAFAHVTWRAAARTDDASATFLTGNFDGLKFDRWGTLNELLLAGKPVGALKGKSIDLLLEAASSPRSKGTIGKNLLAATLMAPTGNMPPVPSSLYISDKAAPTQYALDMVTTINNQQKAIMHGLEISSSDGSTITFPRQPRNAVCSCGSGRKYKHCHGVS